MKLRLLLLAALLLAPAHAQAKPVSVVLYPAGALVTEEETVNPEGRVVLSLPAGADAESLSVSLSSGVVLESRLSVRQTPSSAMEALQRELENVRGELSRASAERKSVSAERRFWADPPTSPAENGQELEALAQETRLRLADLAQKETELCARERELEKEVQNLNARMKALGSHNNAVQECELVIDGKGPATARWTYFLPGASWKPSYCVSAEEKTGLVRIVMNAVLRQDSGADWKNVDVTLASAEDARRVEPPALPMWTEGDERPLLGSANIMAAKAAGAADAQSHATGVYWPLGRLNVPAEGEITRLAATCELPAEFCRLVRPLQDSRAYFTATPASETLPLLPAGQAVVRGERHGKRARPIPPERDPEGNILRRGSACFHNDAGTLRHGRRRSGLHEGAAAALEGGHSQRSRLRRGGTRGKPRPHSARRAHERQDQKPPCPRAQRRTCLL